MKNFPLAASSAAACIVFLGAITALAPSYASTEQFDGYSIETMAECGPVLDEAKGNRLVLFHGSTNTLSGWSHINGNNEYKSMRWPVADYAISIANSKADKSCGGTNTYQAVLVKKYADWDRQHSNGIEPRFLANRISFGNVDSIVLELKVDAAKTLIPDAAKIKSHYGSYIKDADALNNWDGGKVNLGLTLFEEGAEEQENPSFTAARFIEIDQTKYADQWLRITIKGEQLNYFIEQHWKQTPAALADYAKNTIQGLRINPETRSGKVLRNFVPTFDASIPETFKEMGISIKRLEIRLKK